MSKTGYPMSYRRVVGRNGLGGDYGATGTYGFGAEPPEAELRGEQLRRLIAGDLRRLERDQTDENQLPRYADYAGATPEQARLVLEALFTDFGIDAWWPDLEPDERLVPLTGGDVERLLDWWARAEPLTDDVAAGQELADRLRSLTGATA